ncbi:MAG: recombination-associated protein RdgC [Halothiobacillaceae bacterium]
MFFRNLVPYRIDTTQMDAGLLEAAALTEALAQSPFQPTLPAQPESLGWVPALGELLVHEASGALRLSLMQETRSVPAAVVRERVDERAAEIAVREGREVGNREKREMKDAMLIELLPQAFPRRQRITACLDPVSGWLWVDAPSFKRAELMTGALREALGSLPATTPKTQAPPDARMTNWLVDAPPDQFALGGACRLVDPLEGGTVTVNRHDLGDPQILALAESGKEVDQMELIWRDRVSFVLKSDLTLGRLKFLDTIVEQLPDEDDELAQADATFALMVGELRVMMEDLMQALDGEVPAGSPITGGGDDTPPWA